MYVCCFVFFFCKQMTAYEMRISYWSSDVCSSDLDLKSVHKVIGAASRVSFGKPEKMMEFLGVAPGSVTVFGAINDSGGNVSFMLDEELMRHDVINGHPLSNDATTSVSREDLLGFLEATGHVPKLLQPERKDVVEGKEG